MKYSTLTAFVGISAASVHADTYYASAEWQATSAASKSDQIWSQITEDETPAIFPSFIGQAGIFVEAMSPTFDDVADAMPKTWSGSIRDKYIHSVGVVSKCKFVSNGDHQYTGMYEGADFGFCRLSSAVKPTASLPIAPGISVKFMRSGVPSANVVALNSINGQPDDWNFFSKVLYNHVGPGTTTATKALTAKFATFDDHIQQVGLSNLSEYDQDGNKASNVFPFKLGFKAHSSMQGLIPTELENEDYMGYIPQLLKVPTDSTIYDVYALDKPVPLGGVETLIGTLKMDGDFTTSNWGDKNMFFQHQIINEDEKVHPEWEPYYARYSLSGKCPYQNMLKNLNLY